ncbi:MAG: MoaD/ThiS family protein [Candidatus Nanohaloarchaea archaeon]
MIRDDLEERREKEFEVEEGLTVAEFLKSQGIERQEVLVSRHGDIIAESAVLEDGDEINVFDVIAGG